MMFVKPAPGLQVRDPRSKQLLPATGGTVEPNAYWRRRLRDKDVVLAVSPEVEAEAAAAAAAASANVLAHEQPG